MNKAVFLDRDGVINVEKNYLYKIEDFEFIKGVKKLSNNYKNWGFCLLLLPINQESQEAIIRCKIFISLILG